MQSRRIRARRPSQGVGPRDDGQARGQVTLEQQAVRRLMGTSNTPGTLLGGWRIIEMELWDGEAVDLMGAALIEFGQDQTGRFRFVAVEGWMDCRHERREGRPHVEFSWEGHDDSDQAHGRGWATLANDGSLQGRIYFHMGDDSGFRALRTVQRPRPARGAAGRRG